MRYAVDLGNSAAKAALLDGAVVRLPAPTDPRDAVAWSGVAAELIAAIRADAQRAGEPATLRVASVVPAGADALKLFPAEVAGPSGLRAIRAVLPADLRIYAVGGVSPDNLAEQFDALIE